VQGVEGCKSMAALSAVMDLFLKKEVSAGQMTISNKNAHSTFSDRLMFLIQK